MAAIAVEDPEGELSYADLLAGSERYARYLLAQGLRRGEIVAVLLSPSRAQVVVMLGILRAGGVYLPVGLEQPAERTAYMLEDSGARFAVATGPLPAETSARPLSPTPPDAPTTGSPLPPPDPQDPAYVIYTSGSTGRPKGVILPHIGLANLQHIFRGILGLGSDDRVLQFASLTFDASLWETSMALTNGATLVIPPPDVRNSPQLLGEFLRARGITTLTLPPTLIDRVDFASPSASLRWLISAGSELPPAVWRAKRDSVAMVNGYGPSEASICATLLLLDRARDADEAISIGRPIPNTRVYILDEALNPVPEGVPGEIHIGGIGLAWGYLGRPGLTAERFIPDPFAEIPGQRLYRTGDRGQWLADGIIRYLGRQDFQVKLRGFRIECSEIEHVLREHPGVAEAVVVMRDDAHLGEILAGYFVASDTEGTGPTTAELQAHLRAFLPDYMVPAVLMRLDALPLTRHGKVDRDALPDPDRSSQITANAATADTETERRLTAIFASLLGLPEVGRDDSFFDLGGHSLLAVQALARIRDEFGVSLSVSDFFLHHTCAGLATLLEDAGTAPVSFDRIPVRAHADGFPASPAQERLWFLSRMAPQSAAYNVPMAFRIDGELDPQRLDHALARVVERHPILRSRFVEGTPGTPRLLLTDGGEIRLRLHELGEEAATDARGPTLLAELAARPFDLERGPLLRADLLCLTPERHYLLLNAHHSIFDGESVAPLCQELSALYATPEGEPVPPLPSQYADFACWQRERQDAGACDADLRFWRDRLTPLPELLALPTDHPRPPLQSQRGGLVSVALPGALVDQAGALAKSLCLTPFMVFLALFQVLLYRHTRQSDFVIGTPVAGRNRREVEGLIGLFVNMLCLRAELASGMRFETLLERVRTAVLEAYDHQDLAFDRLVEALNPPRDPSHTPLFQVSFSHQRLDAIALRLGKATSELVPVTTGTAKFDLTVTLQERGGLSMLSAEYDTALFREAMVIRLLEHYRRLAELLLEDPGRSIDLDYLEGSDRDLVLQTWNRTEGGFPANHSVLDLFDRRAAEVPERPAVEDRGGEVLTYAQLRVLSLELAARIVGAARGGRASPVLIVLPQSAGHVAAALAALRAGHPYLPVDVSQPPARLRTIVEDARPTAIVTDQAHQALVASAGTPVILLDAPQAIQIRAATNPVGVDDPTYLIYTSGSTGVPKASLLLGRGLLNLVHWHVSTYGLGPGDRTSLLASPSFDAAVWEIWPALASGATLVVADEETRLAPDRLEDWLAEKRISHCFMPTALANILLGDWKRRQPTLPHLRYLLTGGDVLLHQAPSGAGFEVVNHYGPTENTVVTTATEVGTGTLPSQGLPSIGRPILNHRVYILDHALNPVPVGVAGELCIAGEGLSAGYPGRAGLTAEHFIPDPFSALHGARLYRSGDLARWLPGGDIEFLGRDDGQAKIRGFRVECGEVEAMLAAHRLVAEAMVMVRDHPKRGRELAAWIVPAGEARATADALLDHLRQRLPAYMLPASLRVLPAFPLSATGKVDRARLLEEEDGETGSPATLPRDAAERQLHDIWRELLGVETIGIHDDFFALGGHSLLATRLLARIHEETGAEVPLVALFRTPTIAGLSQTVTAGAASGEASPVQALRPFDYLPLGYTQLDFWFVHLGTDNPWNVVGAWLWQGEVDPSLLRRVLQQVIRREPMFWMRIFRHLPRQQLMPPELVEVPFTNLAPLDEQARQEETATLLERLGSAPLDPAAPPICRFHLIELGDGRFVLGYCFSHLVVDGSALAILRERIRSAYIAAEVGSTPHDNLDTSLQEFIAWERSRYTREAVARERRHWQSVLAGLPPLTVRVADEPGSDTAHPMFRIPIADATWAGLAALARRKGCGLQAIMLTLLGRQIARATGTDDLCISVVTEARTTRTAVRLVAPLMREVPVRLRGAAQDDFDTALATARLALDDALAHDHCPWILPVSLLERARWPAPLRFLFLDLLAAAAGRLATLMFRHLDLYPDFLRDYLAFLPVPRLRAGHRDRINLGVRLNIHPGLLDAEPKAASGLIISDYPVRHDLSLPDWVDRSIDVTLRRDGDGDAELLLRGPEVSRQFYNALISGLQADIEGEVLASPSDN